MQDALEAAFSKNEEPDKHQELEQAATVEAVDETKDQIPSEELGGFTGLASEYKEMKEQASKMEEEKKLKIKAEKEAEARKKAEVEAKKKKAEEEKKKKEMEAKKAEELKEQ